MEETELIKKLADKFCEDWAKGRDNLKTSIMDSIINSPDLLAYQKKTHGLIDFTKAEVHFVESLLDRQSDGIASQAGYSKRNNSDNMMLGRILKKIKEARIVKDRSEKND